MSRYYPGMIIRTSYGTGPYKVLEVTEKCTCPSFMQGIRSDFKDNTPSRPHVHLELRLLTEKKGRYMVGGYDDNLQSVWDEDYLIVCSEETTILTFIANGLR